MVGAAADFSALLVPFALTPEQYAALSAAGAGGAAHLPGMIASATPLPVIGVPVKSSNSMDGWDSVLSILQMPKGVPVATVALNGGANAGILATQILGATDAKLRQAIADYKETMRLSVEDMAKSVENQ